MTSPRTWELSRNIKKVRVSHVGSIRRVSQAVEAQEQRPKGEEHLVYLQAMWERFAGRSRDPRRASMRESYQKAIVKDHGFYFE